MGLWSLSACHLQLCSVGTATFMGRLFRVCSRTKVCLCWLRSLIHQLMQELGPAVCPLAFLYWGLISIYFLQKLCLGIFFTFEILDTACVYVLVDVVENRFTDIRKTLKQHSIPREHMLYQIYFETLFNSLISLCIILKCLWWQSFLLIFQGRLKMRRSNECSGFSSPSNFTGIVSVGVRTHMIVAEVKVNVFLVEKAKGVCCLGCLGY